MKRLIKIFIINNNFLLTKNIILKFKKKKNLYFNKEKDYIKKINYNKNIIKL